VGRIALAPGGGKVCANATCPKAGEWQPSTAYYAKKHQKSGRYYPSALCRPCHKRYRQLARESDPAVRKREATLARRKRARIRREGARRANWLPAEPFAAWLRSEVIPRCGSTTAAAQLLHVEDGPTVDALERMIRRLRDGGQQRVRLSSADAVVTAWGDPGLLARLYPDN
jgi:hypothetical protein